MTDTEKEVLCARIDELCAEVERGKVENAKLRELVAYMWTYDYAGHFSTLPEHMEHVYAVWQQMQLLGIEVD